jgi:hypothetical protein
LADFGGIIGIRNIGLSTIGPWDAAELDRVGQYPIAQGYQLSAVNLALGPQP